VSLSVTKGTIATVLGANGAGKTTVLKTISGIIDPQKGSILFRGEAIQKKTRPGSCAAASATCPKGARCFRCCRCTTIS